MNVCIVLYIALKISLSLAVTKDDYIHLGCYRDSIFRAMKEELTYVKSVDECAAMVQRIGYSTFGVQYGRQCFTAADAAAKYSSQGKADGCSYGMGGTWANDVYQLKDDNYRSIGCFKDSTSSRAMPKLFGKWDKSVVIRTCADYARSAGFNTFGVQSGSWCYSGEDASFTYDKYGSATDCASDGTGGPQSNNVYKLPVQKCLSCNGKDKCTQTTCSSEAYCYKLTAEQKHSAEGASKRVTLGGCMSNCTDQGKTDGCAGKKNCHLTCCAYKNCNDPDIKDKYPKCYRCKSTKSEADCKAHQYLIPCGKYEGKQSYCFTAKNGGTYWKDCVDGDSTYCAVQAGLLCANKDSSTCSMKCCTGYGCNHSTKIAASSLLILACAFIRLLL